MLYNFDYDKIEQIYFKSYFEKMNYFSKIFYENKYFKLLSYLSTLFNDSTIITFTNKENNGENAVSLSYNVKNKVYDFNYYDYDYDFNIVKIKDNLNIKVNEKLILDSKLIVLDFENLEEENNKVYELYEFLLLNEYKGLLLCNNIWYDNNLRNNFLYKIDRKLCVDLSIIGDIDKGTMLIDISNVLTIDKPDISNWTLVTAYFDLTLFDDASEEIKQRDEDYYLSHCLSTMSIPYNLVIYCDAKSFKKIEKIRPKYLLNKTYFVICNLDDFFVEDEKYVLTFPECRKKIKENREKNPPIFFDFRNTPSYYLFCLSRYIMLKKTIQLNKFKSTHFSWINFCIERMGYKNLMHLEEALSVNRNKFSTCYIDYIPESLVNNTKVYFEYGRCSMCSGFFTGNIYFMEKVCDLIIKQFLIYLHEGYGHADEQLYSPVYFKNRDLFEHYYGDYRHMITNYKYIYDDISATINVFMYASYFEDNSIKSKEKCLDACEFLYNSYIKNKCYVSEIDLYNLNWYRENLLKIFNRI